MHSHRKRYLYPALDLSETVAPLVQIGNYKILHALGEGGMGRVWMGRHTYLDHTVVIKSLHPQYAQSDQLRARFFLEARLLSQLDHPAIVHLYEFTIQEGTPYLIMEYVQGESLEKYLERHGMLSPEEALALLGPILDALEYLHNQKVIHRDLKPANILVRPEGGAKLIDFGIAKALDEDLKLTQTGMRVGTLLYMAPEQIQGKPVSPQTDLYAMGLILYECLFGHFPWEWRGLTEFQLYQKLLTELPPLPQWAPDSWKAFFTTALAKEPHKRYPSAQAMHEALAALSKGKAILPPTDPEEELKEQEAEPEETSAPLTPTPTASPSFSSPVEAPPLPAPESDIKPAPPTPPPQTSPPQKKPLSVLTLLLAAAAGAGIVLFLLSLPETKGPKTPRSKTKPIEPSENPALSTEIREAFIRKLQLAAASSADKIEWTVLPSYEKFPLAGMKTVAFVRRFSEDSTEVEEITEPCYLSGIPIGRPKGVRTLRIHYGVSLTCEQRDKATVTYRYDRHTHRFAAFDLQWPPRSKSTTHCTEIERTEIEREVGDCTEPE